MDQGNFLTRPRFDKILSEEVAELPPDALEIYEGSATGVVEQTCYRSEQNSSERVFVVARDGARLLLFDDAEDEFGIGILGDDGVLREWDLYGELVFAIRMCLRECFVCGAVFSRDQLLEHSQAPCQPSSQQPFAGAGRYR